MVKLNKPQIGPEIPYLIGRNAGRCKLVVKTEYLKKDYEVNSNDYDSGSKDLSFDNGLWGEEIIKESLKVKVQKNRCCYCEKDITDGGSLEHFRPKNGAKQKRGDSIEKPGYYWLAYKWSNWFYSCQECNNAKDTIFPLADPTKRAKNHLADESCSMETPLLINLSSDSPEEMIHYKGVEVFPNSSNKGRGSIIIETVKLDRKSLLDTRTEHCEPYWRIKDAIELGVLGQDAVVFHNESLEKAAIPGNKFSYMMKCNLEDWKITSSEAFLYRLRSNLKSVFRKIYHFFKSL